MQYKVRYQPLEKLGRDGWTRFDPAERDAALSEAPASPSSPRQVELATILRK